MFNIELFNIECLIILVIEYIQENFSKTCRIYN